MPALPRRFVIWFSLHYSKPESFSDAVLDKCGIAPVCKVVIERDDPVRPVRADGVIQ